MRPAHSGFDYASPGAYFVTVCSWMGREISGRVSHGRLVLNPCGALPHDCWRGLSEHFPNLGLGNWIVMPNHIHGIVFLGAPAPTARGPDDATTPTPVSGGTPRTVRGPDVRGGGQPRGTVGPGRGQWGRTVDACVAPTIRNVALRGTPGAPVWQRGFHDRIIRDDHELRRIAWYIDANPSRWGRDLQNSRPHLV